MRFFRVALVIALAMVAVAYKQTATAAGAAPSVLLVADLREAGEGNDGCAVIIRSVRDAAAHGVHVQELTPDSASPLLKTYRIVTIPTVVILGADGHEQARFVGENGATIKLLQAKLATLGAH